MEAGEELLNDFSNDDPYQFPDTESGNLEWNDDPNQFPDTESVNLEWNDDPYQFPDTESVNLEWNDDPYQFPDTESGNLEWDEEELYITCFTESMSMFELVDKHQRQSDSDEKCLKLLKYIAADDFVYGINVILDETGKRMKWWSYVPLHEFSDVVGVGKPRIPKRDLFEGIMEGSTKRIDTFPLYFKHLFKLANENIFLLTEFMESVDYCLTPMISLMLRDLRTDGEEFGKLARLTESEKYDKSLKDLDSLIFRLQHCKNTLNDYFWRFYHASGTLKSIFSEISEFPDTSLCSNAIVKICRLRDFVNFALTLYMNDVLKTTRVMASCLFTSRELFSLCDQ